MTIKTGHRALVTGAASGLGLALTTQLAARGVRVLATDVADLCPDALRHVDGVTYRRLDVVCDDDWARTADWVASHWSGLDLVFNNAGVAAGGRIELIPLPEWQWIIDINLLGVVRGCRTFAPVFKRQRSGHIVNTASAAGLVHPPRMSSYNAVKAAVVALSETLHYELAPYGVRTSVVCPTFFRTNLASSLPDSDPDAQAAARRLIDGAKRSADEVAGVVLAGVDRGQFLIIPDRTGRTAYAVKRLARRLYDRQMARAGARAANRAGADRADERG